MDTTGPVAAWFPLVGRPRPPCTSLDQRVSALCARAEAATANEDPVTASAVLNQAALIASDCGDPELARYWCHRHSAAYLRAGLTGAQAARNTLEPLVNLARLHIRASDGQTAYTILDTLVRAISDATDITIDGLYLATKALIRDEDDQQQVRQWLWAVHLADGTRALTTEHRWQDALHHLNRHHGIGNRMLDGRQVAIIAAHQRGDETTVADLLDTTEPGPPTENAVAACLRRLCTPGDTTDDPTAAMWRHHSTIDPTAGQAVFYTRLTLSMIDAAGGPNSPRAGTVIKTLAERIIEWADGYVARDLLHHQGLVKGLSDRHTRRLKATTDAAALDAGTVPAEPLHRLTNAVEQAEAVIGRPTYQANRGAVGTVERTLV